ncbi:MAG: carbamate kinase, partial [Odoribacter sp.]
MKETKLAVVALGGNAILRGNQKGTVEEQNQNIRETLENLIYLVREGYNLIITHGNGPQVGNILMSDDAGVKMYGLPPMSLDMCVAYSQGEIGYMIERNLRNILKKYNLERDVVSMISQVVVDKNDPAMKNPTKRVGKIYSQEEANKLSTEHGWIFKEEIKVEGGWRRVVPSPAPIDFKNAA